ncbi:MAG: alpha/beta fold hydrolase [Deltaproteobacteria bacterium]|nr:alpha/beta fold hydrolase [Deltaproteobacteria bacterium]
MLRRLVACLVVAVLASGCDSHAEANTSASISHLALGGDGPVVVVLLHGYGSRPEDLAPFAARTDLPPGTRILLPRAPLSTHPPVGPEGGHMWWSFPHEFRDLRAQHLEGVREAQRQVSALLDRETDANDRIVLGGFSQGAMLALDVAAHDPRPLAGLVLLSGTLMDEAELVPRLASRRGLRVRMTHGRADDVLPYARAEDLHRALVGAGLDVRLDTFEGGHEVTMAVSEGTAAFVREVTTSP